MFELQPNKAIINDINKALIYTYKIIRVFPRELCNILNVKRMINSNVTNRKGQEIIITNY